MTTTLSVIIKMADLSRHAMDQLTQNIEKLRRSVDSHVERMLIKHDDGLFEIADSAFDTPAIRLQAADEPLVVPVNAAGLNRWEQSRNDSAIVASGASKMIASDSRKEVPAVVSQSVLQRFFSRVGLR